MFKQYAEARPVFSLLTFEISFIAYFEHVTWNFAFAEFNFFMLYLGNTSHDE